MHIPAPPRRRSNTLIITSLVDVMFVLLFFFMLTSSYLDWGALKVNIAGSGHAAAPSAHPLLVLQLLPGGALRLNGQAVAATELIAAVRRVTGAHVVVQPAPGVPLQDLVGVIDRLQSAGVKPNLGSIGKTP
ncbi:MAG: ExbD/TolR family protein [Stenotrophobium sp.]